MGGGGRVGGLRVGRWDMRAAERVEDTGGGSRLCGSNVDA